MSNNNNLPLSKSIPLGIQHVFAMFAGNITVPIIVAGIIVNNRTNSRRYNCICFKFNFT